MRGLVFLFSCFFFILFLLGCVVGVLGFVLSMLSILLFFFSFSFFFLKCVGAGQSRILAFPFFPLELRFVLGSVLVVVFN